MSTMLLESMTVLVTPWYWQFYLVRGDAPWESDKVSPEGYDAHLEAIDGFVYVGTSTYGHPTEVRVEVHDSDPPDVREDADTVVEVSVSGEGRLGVFNWEPLVEPVATIDVPIGPLRIRGTWLGYVLPRCSQTDRSVVTSPLLSASCSKCGPLP